MTILQWHQNNPLHTSPVTSPNLVDCSLDLPPAAILSLTMEDPKKERYIYQYAHLETVNCVVKSGCVPCLYKLFPDGGKDAKLGQVAAVALAKQIEASEQLLEQIKIPNNQRPEMCPRAKADDDRKPFTMYCQEVGTTALPGAPSSVLTVGDGDFTFSLSLAKLLCGGNSETEAKVEFTATSHESLQSVLTTYKPHAQETLAALRDLSVTVLHGVDATSLADTPELRKESKKNKRKLDDDGPDSSKIKMKRYDVVIWNFPCISLPAGADGQARELQANKELLAKFFLNVRRCLSKGTGEVHISHKTLEPFSWWGIRQIATDCGFDFAYAVAFDRYTALWLCCISGCALTDQLAEGLVGNMYLQLAAGSGIIIVSLLTLYFLCFLYCAQRL